ncbi:MAG: hypothetical protein HGA36_05110 [Candidatus Moranbacteria bacterium]|nr:hypothetical protein [Candidatus Moranbacteria bacterium]
MKERLIEINKALKNLNYEDIAYNDGLMSQRAMLLMLDKELPTEFSFGVS